jgi:hypothetical protein
MIIEFYENLKINIYYVIHQHHLCMAQNFCMACGTELIPGKEVCTKCSVRVPGVSIVAGKKQYPKDIPENRAKKMKEYKVVVMEDVWHPAGSGKFNKNLLEDMLNSYGFEGWSMKVITKRQIPGIASLTTESIIILERDMPLEP